MVAVKHERLIFGVIADLYGSFILYNGNMLKSMSQRFTRDTKGGRVEYAVKRVE